MELDTQIKKYRTGMKLSQEEWMRTLDVQACGILFFSLHAVGAL